MRIGSVSLFLILFNFVSGADGHVPEEGKIFASVGPYFHEVSEVHVQDTQSSPASVGFGILGEGDVNDKGGFEIGIFYGTKTYQRKFGDTHLSERVNKLSVPVSFRYWLHPTFSAAIGFDASYTMGVPEVVFNDAPLGSNLTSARNITEYGIDFSGQWEAWSKDRFAIIVDARYFYSITARSAEDSNQYSVLIGLKYLIQEKHGSED